MKNLFKVCVAIVEWTALAAAITFGCAIGGEGATMVVDNLKKKKKGGDSIVDSTSEKIEP